jgi:hypothetical protein
MPRWYALCRGNDLPACAICRRHVDHNGSAQHEARQGFTGPDLVGTHCNRFIELPPVLGVAGAVTPTDSR